MSENNKKIAKYTFTAIGVIWTCAAITKLYYTFKAAAIPGVTHITLASSFSFDAAVHGTWIAILGGWMLKD